MVRGNVIFLEPATLAVSCRVNKRRFSGAAAKRVLAVKSAFAG